MYQPGGHVPSNRTSTNFSGLPAQAPDAPVTVIVAECASVPIQNALSSIVDVT
jgi:hypothetical protein